MNFSGIFCLALFGIGFVHTAPTTPLPPVKITPSWARPDDLLGFWPLSNYYKLRDVSGNGRDAQGFTLSSPNSRPGPFGDPQTSYSSYSASNNGGVFQVESEDFSVSGLKSFTFSLFLRDVPTMGGGFLQFLDADGETTEDPLRFTFEYKYKLSFYGGGVEGGVSFEEVFWDNIWNYLAVTVVQGENDECTVQLFGRFGQKTDPLSAPFLCKALKGSSGGFRVGTTAGSYNRWSSGTYVSCFMFYKSALTADEIFRNYESCRAVLMGPPCGSPRLPIASLPEVPAVVPKPGQFPWVASLHHSTGVFDVTCTATIIDAYHLLTAGTCFNEDLHHPDNYYVYVGNYDHMSWDTKTKKHEVRNVAFHTLSRQKYNSIAVIELDEPIDFSNPYVSEACLPIEDLSPAIYNSSLFVIGWGENGRPAASSSSERKWMRYAPGQLVDDDTCAKSWFMDPFKKDGVLKCFLGDPDATVPCKGDLGSPLAVHVDGKLVQFGLYNNRDEDCTSTRMKLPIFTRIDTIFSNVIRESLASAPARHN